MQPLLSVMSPLPGQKAIVFRAETEALLKTVEMSYNSQFTSP